MPTNTLEKLKAIRQQMADSQIQAYLIPSSDPHGSEYVAPHWRAREWISGFTGSAGTAVITAKKAGIWTDGRYFIQAERELKDSGFQLFKMGQPGVPTPSEFIKNELNPKEAVGFDGRTLNLKAMSDMKRLFRKKEINMVTHLDLVQNIWTDRPALPQNPIFEHALEFAGKSRVEKIAEIREQMKAKDIDIQCLGALDDIAWTFNYRGSDIDHTPVAYAFAIITAEQATLYIKLDKVPKPLMDSFNNDNITVKAYDTIYDDVQTWPLQSTVLIDPAYTNQLLAERWSERQLIITEDHCTPTILKSQKNETEIKNYRTCMEVDGLAMIKFLKWLDENVSKGSVTECKAEDIIDGYRAESPHFMDTSFKTISAHGSNGAMMHYSAAPERDVPITTQSLYLVDSGGQYPFGTTDLTRTMSFGETTEQERKDYTLVLRGMINLSMPRFRYGVAGVSLDTLARGILWQEGIDYNSGTGHGVGICLSVHEGPASFSPRPNPSLVELNMFITNEPGIYREGCHGIRIENILRVIEDESNEFGKFYRFETLTLTPICKRPIMVDMMTDKEIQWLNDYHAEVYSRLLPLCEHDDLRAWLKGATSPLEA